jgi:hypothetical protein
LNHCLCIDVQFHFCETHSVDISQSFIDSTQLRHKRTTQTDMLSKSF